MSFFLITRSTVEGHLHFLYVFGFRYGSLCAYPSPTELLETYGKKTGRTLYLWIVLSHLQTDNPPWRMPTGKLTSNSPGLQDLQSFLKISRQPCGTLEMRWPASCNTGGISFLDFLQKLYETAALFSSFSKIFSGFLMDTGTFTFLYISKWMKIEIMPPHSRCFRKTWANQQWRHTDFGTI